MSVEVAYPHIEKKEGDAARLKRLPRTRVSQIVLSYQESASSVEQMLARYPHLRPAEIYMALAYYHDHKEELDKELEEELKQADEDYRNAPPSPVLQRIRDRQAPADES